MAERLLIPPGSPAFAAIERVPGVRWSNYPKGWMVPLDLTPRPPTAAELAAVEARVSAGIARVPKRLWGVLRPRQREDVEFALRYQGALVCHPTAGGKTLTGIAILAAMGACEGGYHLVSGPALSRATWRDEFRKWLPEVPLTTLRGQSPSALAGPGVYFVNYEVASFWGTTLSSYEWETLVLDECHEIKGPKTDRGLGLRRAVGMSTPLVVGLTATPIWSRFVDLWNQLDMVHPGWYGTYSQFAQRYSGATVQEAMGGAMRWIEIGRASATEELDARLQYVVRRVSREAVENLPDADRQVCRVNSPEAAQRLAQAAKRIAEQEHSDSEVKRLIGAALHKETPAKLEKLPEILQGLPTDRVLILTQLKASAKKATEQLTALGHTTFNVDGSKTHEARRAIIATAAEIEGPVILCATGPSVRQSMNDLAGAFSAMVVLELPWTGEEAIQYEGRLLRPQQVAKEVAIRYVVIDNSIDSDILDLIGSKLEDRRLVLPGDDALSTTLSGQAEQTISNLVARWL